MNSKQKARLKSLYKTRNKIAQEIEDIWNDIYEYRKEQLLLSLHGQYYTRLGATIVLNSKIVAKWMKLLPREIIMCDGAYFSYGYGITHVYIQDYKTRRKFIKKYGLIKNEN